MGGGGWRSGDVSQAFPAIAPSSPTQSTSETGRAHEPAPGSTMSGGIFGCYRQTEREMVLALRGSEPGTLLHMLPSTSGNPQQRATWIKGQ